MSANTSPRPVDSLADLEERLALWCQFREPLPLVKYASVRELLTASLYYIREQRNSHDSLDELVRGAILLLNGDCPLTELNCDDWLRRARAALKAAKGEV